MMTPLCKEWVRADAIKGSSESAVNQSHRDVTLSRDVAHSNGHLINPSEPNNGKAPIPAHSASMQSTRRSRDPRLSASPYTRSILQETSMIQPAAPSSPQVVILKIAIDPRDDLPLLFSHSVELTSHDPAIQPVPAIISFPPGVPIHTFRVTTGPRNGQSVILSSETVDVTGYAPNTVVDPSNGTSGSDVKAREAHDDNHTMAPMMFETALKEFVIKHIVETRDQTQTTIEFHDFIVQKTVDKIMRSENNIPSTEERIGKYLSSYKGKIEKLIQEYFHKYEAKSLQ